MHNAPVHPSALEYAGLLEGLDVPLMARQPAAEALVAINDAITSTEVRGACQRGEQLLDKLLEDGVINIYHHKTVGHWMDDASSAKVLGDVSLDVDQAMTSPAGTAS